MKNRLPALEDGGDTGTNEAVWSDPMRGYYKDVAEACAATQLVGNRPTAPTMAVPPAGVRLRLHKPLQSPRWANTCEGWRYCFAQQYWQHGMVQRGQQ